MFIKQSVIRRWRYECCINNDFITKSSFIRLSSKKDRGMHSYFDLNCSSILKLYLEWFPFYFLCRDDESSGMECPCVVCCLLLLFLAAGQGIERIWWLWSARTNLLQKLSLPPFYTIAFALYIAILRWTFGLKNQYIIFHDFFRDET